MKKIATATTIASYLTVPKQDFRTQLLSRLSDGEAFLSNAIKDASIISEIQQNYSMWNDYNLELLRQSFNIPDNEYWRHPPGSWHR